MRIILSFIIIFVSIFSCAAFAAETVHLTLTGATQGLIKGESTQTSLGRENTIECLSYVHSLITEPDPRTGIAGEVRDHFPVTISKRIDKSSPRLFKAWRNRERLEGEFWFYRPNPTGDGTTQQFYKVFLHAAYISGIRQEVLSTLNPQTSTMPTLERISFTYSGIEEVWMPDGFSYGDDWHANTTNIPLSDVNFDGIVNMKDYAIPADEWLMQY